MLGVDVPCNLEVGGTSDTSLMAQPDYSQIPAPNPMPKSLVKRVMCALQLLGRVPLTSRLCSQPSVRPSGFMFALGHPSPCSPTTGRSQVRQRQVPVMYPTVAGQRDPNRPLVRLVPTADAISGQMLQPDAATPDYAASLNLRSSQEASPACLWPLLSPFPTKQLFNGSLILILKSRRGISPQRTSSSPPALTRNRRLQNSRNGTEAESNPPTAYLKIVKNPRLLRCTRGHGRLPPPPPYDTSDTRQ